MAIVAQDAVAEELPLNDERLEKKVPRHITIALNHVGKQRAKALVRYEQARDELETIDKMMDLAKG